MGLSILTAAVVILASGSSFMHTWFYIFAWWPFILILDSVNYRKSGASPLFSPSRTTAFMLFVSVGVWLIFELFNLRLQNWSYHGLPAQAWQRWLGYTLAFASVIPAIYELSELFFHYLRERKTSFVHLKNTAAFRGCCFVLGLTCLVLTLVWPQVFFPLVWLGFFLLLEPINYHLGSACFLQELAEDNWGRFRSWGLAGLSAGFTWELFNFWAGSHWEYHLPYLDFARVFQMPVFGYIGFMPFALEVFVLYSLLGYLYGRYMEGRIARQAVGVLSVSLIYMVVFYLIDRYSVVR